LILNYVSTQTILCNDVFGFNFLPDVNWTKTEYGANDPEGSFNFLRRGERRVREKRARERREGRGERRGEGAIFIL